MNLYLIGYRGCGKSSVGPLLAERLGWKSVDSDDVIEANAGTTIAEIFASHGEATFRELEQKAIAGIALADQQVVSLGGGAVMFEPNRAVVATTGKAIYLSGSAEVLWSRISGDAVSTTQRPDLTDQGGFAEVQSVLAVRTSVYEACADYTIDTNELTIEEVTQQILAWWQMVDR